MTKRSFLIIGHSFIFGLECGSCNSNLKPYLIIGILLDSSRNFMPIDVIENVINGMAFNKVISDLLKHGPLYQAVFLNFHNFFLNVQNTLYIFLNLRHYYLSERDFSFSAECLSLAFIRHAKFPTSTWKVSWNYRKYGSVRSLWTRQNLHQGSSKGPNNICNKTR